MPDTGAEKGIPEIFTDGKWIGTAMGHDDELIAEVVVANGDLASIRVLRCDDTIGIGTTAAPMMAARILEAKNLDVDVVSGATTTSIAVRNAVSDAIMNAGGDLATFSLGAAEPSGGTDQAVEVDVALAGAGTAGLIAAVRLLEAGKSVVLFEKQDIAGGSMPMTYSGVAAAESELQANYAVGRHDENPMFSKAGMLAIMSKYLVPENDRFDGAMPYQTAMYDNSGKLVDWLHGMGVGFYSLGVNPAYGVTPYLAPGCYMGGCGYAKDFLVDRVGALGGQIIYATKVTELSQDSDGRVTGLLAEGRDGSTWTVTAKAVCLTTGGFAANPEMIAEHYPEYAEYKFNCAPGSTGEGILMGQKAGGAVECMGRELGAFLSTTSQAGSNFEIAFLYQTTPGIIVNASGAQFGNMMSDNHGMLGRGLRDAANGGAFFYITDESGRITTNKNELYAMDTYKCLERRGDMVHFASVEEAATALDLPQLEATIEAHNAHALAGEEDEFGRKNLPYLDTYNGIWIVSCIPTFYLTTGGLAIDTAGHVLTEDGKPVAGLYAAGDVCGSIEEKDGRPYAMGFDAAMNYGYLMAEAVIADL
ncbi:MULTISPECIES: FAD-binding protein [Adlercreutzia]|uniref:FAD-binding protein n=1 Tax=Adlercreutzia TaxID=447020 RepID=UPI001D0814E9|nr:FAD-binding protein [Adlercreutzia rubneri]MCB6759634.1 FAD-dependent oxidoreductase [Adlercreutzia equolifaciens]MCB6975364.1 FAD-dependent oxidoreductase [Adlercreutzia equolifaciens]MDE8683150.1 FAD-dependent oxidoreductase [Adlercreutzia rubneri]